MANKTYINWISVKEIEGKFWNFFNVSFNLEKLKEYQNEKWYINATISKRKESGKYWETHSVTLNEYRPKEETKKDDEFLPF